MWRTASLPLRMGLLCAIAGRQAEPEDGRGVVVVDAPLEAPARARPAGAWLEHLAVVTPTAVDLPALLRQLGQGLAGDGALVAVVTVPDAAELRQLAARWRHRDLVLEEWGLAGGSTRGRGVSALFSGASGTGKTLAAEIVAGDLGLDLFKLDLSAVVSKYIGETEKNLRRVFDAAETGGAVLLFDEADALFGKRTDIRDAHDKYANQEIAYLLQRIENYHGLVILASNQRGNIDEARGRHAAGEGNHAQGFHSHSSFTLRPASLQAYA